MKPEAHAEALLALIESERAVRCRGAEEPAEREARALVAAARRAARARVATAIAEERATHAARVAAAEARLATARRMARQRRLKALLAEAWQRLPALLAARWADPASRRQWIDAAQAVARERLPAGEPRVEMRDDGIRIACGRVVLDATIPGLLADRLSVEGRLLHFFEPEAR